MKNILILLSVIFINISLLSQSNDTTKISNYEKYRIQKDHDLKISDTSKIEVNSEPLVNTTYSNNDEVYYNNSLFVPYYAPYLLVDAFFFPYYYQPYFYYGYHYYHNN